MKQVLLATTALVMTAGYAAAEVSVSGDGRMGVVYKPNVIVDDNDTPADLTDDFLYNDSEANFTSRIRAKFTMTGETDTGLSFGGEFRVDHQDNSGGKASDGDAGSIYISGSYGKLTMGDIDSAAEKANGDLYGVGLTGLGDFNEIGYYGSGGEGGGNPGALYEYSFGDTTVYASMYDGNNAKTRADLANAIYNDTDLRNGSGDVSVISGLYDKLPQSDAWSLGAKYSIDTFTVGFGYADSSDSGFQQIALSGEGTFAGVGVKAVYARTTLDGSKTRSGQDIDADQYGLSGKYAFDAYEVAAYWVRDTSINSGSSDINTFGLGASYDLGGGATLQAGVVDVDTPNVDTVADMGISFKF